HQDRRWRVRHFSADDGRRRPACGTDVLHAGEPARPDDSAEERQVKRLLIVSLIGLSANLSAEQPINWPSERPPQPLPAHEIKFPPYAVRTLANGLQVIAVSHHEQPVVSLRLIVRAGAAQDPDNRPGVAAMAASLLDQGTTRRSAAQIASTID